MTGDTIECMQYLLEKERELRWEVKPYKQPRTSRQNAYYWALASQVADALRMSKNEVHNRMLRDYGQPRIVDGEVVYVMIPDTDLAERAVLRASTYHLKPTSQVRAGNDHGYRAYMLMRGSSEYNTAEMTVLLDGLIQEAKQLDIETLTPAELERMRVEDEKSERRKSKKRDTA